MLGEGRGRPTRGRHRLGTLAAINVWVLGGGLRPRAASPGPVRASYAPKRRADSGGNPTPGPSLVRLRSGRSPLVLANRPKLGPNLLHRHPSTTLPLSPPSEPTAPPVWRCGTSADENTRVPVTARSNRGEGRWWGRGDGDRPEGGIGSSTGLLSIFWCSGAASGQGPPHRGRCEPVMSECDRRAI